PRCDRPSPDVSSLPALQPGGLAHGPDEKYGLAGRIWGLAWDCARAPSTAWLVVKLTLLAESSRRVGTAWPGAGSKAESGVSKARRKIRVRAAGNHLNLLESQSRSHGR